MPKTVKGANAENILTEETDEPFVDVDLARKKRRSIRSQLTSTSRALTEDIKKAGSRGAMIGLVQHLQDLLKQAATIHTELLIAEELEENEKQEEIHLRYVQEAGEIIAKVDQHLDSRKNEAPSVIQPRCGGRRQAKREEELQAAQQRADDARSQAEEAHSRAEELRNQQEEAEEALLNLQLGDDDADDHLTSVSQHSHVSQLATNWKLRQRQENAPLLSNTTLRLVSISVFSSTHSSRNIYFSENS
ncbi:hypothetical protein DAPPUDRAFT_102738 [Daphnia pulex]|uniref:Uncharacterized protein n=1 Tax=Daphnia pulex TaxID=6669 RepID=E9GHD0_DAPPU|nr:hypothetical protein DAPPUDRAFT_102738 [Daphnia pulex]|eukprot:EFX81200.1 hypothetical protein DAPPUDRAFT_102738 [Daphnia pulex]